nr:uncharacterized protein CI109_004887 [Kwoniella shandongensis]KAA5526684.1 hypothetical protein CI109_004887 [Kwoniella shandongensis]
MTNCDIPSSSSLTDAIPLPSDDAQDTTVTDPSGTEEPPKPLRPLTSLSWPPEPEESIFTDPLKREDPKPLRREELLRITTSSSLRTLLNTTSLPSILRLLDSLPPSARHSMLSRLLGLDPQTLSQPAGSTASFLSGRDSPPPLDELLNTIVAARSTSSGTGTGTGTGTGNEDGWWLRGSGGEKIWIGEEEKKIMRLFAGSVCTAIDGKADGEGEIAWGQGGLEWEV